MVDFMKAVPWSLTIAVLLLGGCTRSDPQRTVELLMGHPERLQSLHQQCESDRDNFGDEFCDLVAEATRRRIQARPDGL